MAKFIVAGRSVVRVDDSGSTIRDISAYVDTFSDMGKTIATVDVTSFADAAERFIAGIETSQEITVSGHFDDTATTGPDAVFAGIVGGTARTLEYNPVGTASGARKISGEFLCTNYMISGPVKERVSYSAVLKLDGTITVGTN